jgi:hypothetical protein
MVGEGPSQGLRLVISSMGNPGSLPALVALVWGEDTFPVVGAPLRYRTPFSVQWTSALTALSCTKMTTGGWRHLKGLLLVCTH